MTDDRIGSGPDEADDDSFPEADDDTGPFVDTESEDVGPFGETESGGSDPFSETRVDDEVDPFAALGAGVDDTEREDTGGDTGVWDDLGHADGSDGTDFDAAGGTDDPFAELGAAEAATDSADPFEEMDVGEVDETDVWEALDDDLGTEGGTGAGRGAAGDERVVDKRSYCQRCPHFTAPPETACTHEGTAIVEAVDFGRFRVRNCPMIDADDPAFDGE